MADNKLNQIAMTLGFGVAGYLLITWLLPKFSKPKVAPVAAKAPMSMNAPVAQGAVAQAQGVGPVRDYNLSGLAIEELESYPMGGGVQLSGI